MTMSSIETISAGAYLLKLAIDKIGLGQPQYVQQSIPKKDDFVSLYDALVKSDDLIKSTRKLFVDGHYARAVEEAYKCVNNTIKDKSQLTKDGHDLMNQAFSEKKPVLKINSLKTVSQRDEQVGYMHIFGGCMTGIRNPRAHEHKKTDSPDVALEMLVWANHLMNIAQKAKRVKKPKPVKLP